MLFGAQYEDESGPSPTQPRKKKSGTRRAAASAAGAATAKAPTGSSRRGDKRNAAAATTTTPSTAAAAAATTTTTFSPSSSYQSTSSSSLNSLAGSFNNENTGYNYNYNLGQLGRFTYGGEGFEPPAGGRLSAANTPVKAAMAATPSKRRVTEPVKRYAKLFGVLSELAPPPEPVDKTVMYPAVWKTLRFRKKMIQLASSLSVKPVCVTGVDGFLGSWIVGELLKRGYRVRGTVQSRKDDVSGILALPAAKKSFSVVETSLLTPEACDMAVQGARDPSAHFFLRSCGH